MFLYIFSFTLLIANIYYFLNRKYLYLFIPCMLFLPNYYGIEISDSLPIITVTRMMFLIFFLYAIVHRKRDLKLNNIKEMFNNPRIYLLLSYFFARVVSNLYYITTYSQALKTIMVIIFEQFFLLLAFYLLKPNEHEVLTTIKCVVWTSFFLFVAGIFESLTSIRIFDALYTVERQMLNDHYYRLGLMRATTTLGLPGIYGNMCILIFPLILFLYEKKKQKIYLIMIVFNILAIIHSGSRSDCFFFIILSLIHTILFINNNHRRAILFKNIFIISIIVIVFIGLLSLLDKNLHYYYWGTAISLARETGLNTEQSEESLEKIVEYGENKNGAASRKKQLYSLYYVANKNPLFGMGSGAQVRGDIQYYRDGIWKTSHTYDLGIVEIFDDEGIIGTLGVTCLIIFMIILAMHSHYKSLSILAYLLSTLSTVNMFSYLFFYLFFFIWGKDESL